MYGHSQPLKYTQAEGEATVDDLYHTLSYNSTGAIIVTTPVHA